MERLKIEVLGSKTLRQRAEEVERIDDELRQLVQKMLATMYHADGAGLAAPQVGISRRLIVLDVGEAGSGPLALINPRVVEAGAEVEPGEEACLSIPGVDEVLEWPSRVLVEALDPDSAPVRIEGSGSLAQCLQHEIDHLDGTLYIDRLSPLKLSLLLMRYRKLQEA